VARAPKLGPSTTQDAAISAVLQTRQQFDVIPFEIVARPYRLDDLRALLARAGGIG